MIVIRNSFAAKPGMAGKLAAHMKEMAQLGNMKNCRVMTDVTGDFNCVVMEHEVESLAEFEAMLQKYGSDPRIREKMKGYLELWTSGKRELFRLA